MRFRTYKCTHSNECRYPSLKANTPCMYCKKTSQETRTIWIKIDLLIPWYVRCFFGFFKPKNIRRQYRYFRQRRNRGFDDSELWNFDYTIAKFMAPRMKVFIENVREHGGVPIRLTKEDGSDPRNEQAFAEWILILKKIQRAFQLMIDEENAEKIYTQEQYDQMDEGLKLFGEWYKSLWT